MVVVGIDAEITGATWTVSRFNRGESNAYACDRALQLIVPRYQQLYDLARKYRTNGVGAAGFLRRLPQAGRRPGPGSRPPSERPASTAAPRSRPDVPYCGVVNILAQACAMARSGDVRPGNVAPAALLKVGVCCHVLTFLNSAKFAGARSRSGTCLRTSARDGHQGGAGILDRHLFGSASQHPSSPTETDEHRCERAGAGSLQQAGDGRAFQNRR